MSSSPPTKPRRLLAWSCAGLLMLSLLTVACGRAASSASDNEARLQRARQAACESDPHCLRP